MGRSGFHVRWLVTAASVPLIGCSQDGSMPGAEPPAPPRVDAAAHDQRATSAPEPETAGLSVAEPSPSEPVKAVMGLRPATAEAGAAAELLISVRIARAHYVHAPGDPESKFAPLSVDLELPDGVTASGEWIFPPPQTRKGGVPEYRDVALLRRSLDVASTLKPQTLTVRGVLHYQACTEELCWPAGKMELSAPLVISTKPR